MLDGVPILVLANKQDVEVSLSSQHPHSGPQSKRAPSLGVEDRVSALDTPSRMCPGCT